jgi:hypothetical protein
MARVVEMRHAMVRAFCIVEIFNMSFSLGGFEGVSEKRSVPNELSAPAAQTSFSRP